MLEKNLERLAAAIEDNTAAIREQGALLAALTGDAVPKKAASKKTAGKKEPAKDAKSTKDPAADAGEKPSVEATEKKTEAAAQEPAAELKSDDVQSHLRAIASQLTDTSKLFDIIKKHGGDQFSDLEPSCYADLVKEADELLASEQAE